MTETEVAMPSPKYAEILDAAARLFSERGYRNTSMRELSDAVGLKAGSLYSHISSKEQILQELVLDVGGLMVAAAARADTLDGTAVERLEAYIRNHLQLVQRHRPAVALLTFEWRSLEHPEQAVALRDQTEKHLSNILEDGLAAGEFYPVDDRWARFVVLSVTNWSSQWFSGDGAQSPAEVAQGFVNVLMSGFKPR